MTDSLGIVVDVADAVVAVEVAAAVDVAVDVAAAVDVAVVAFVLLLVRLVGVAFVVVVVVVVAIGGLPHARSRRERFLLPRHRHRQIVQPSDNSFYCKEL
jgi:hypothetical protein